MAGKKGMKRAAPRRCAYQHGEERCYKWALGTSDFCSLHALPLPPAQTAEANAFGQETAMAMREELAVDEPRPAGRREVVAEEPEDDLPAAAVQDPIRYAMEMAIEEVARAYREDNAARAKARSDGQRMSPTDRARMTLAAYMPHFDDPAAMVGAGGKPLVRPGWIPRWVRDKDEDGRPNTRRLRSFYAQGAEDVLDEDGRPLVGRLGRAVQIPPEVYAARVLHYSPSGAFDTNPNVQNAAAAAEVVNSAAGRRIIDIRPAAEHGSRRGGF